MGSECPGKEGGRGAGEARVCGLSLECVFRRLGKGRDPIFEDLEGMLYFP